MFDELVELLFYNEKGVGGRLAALGTDIRWVNDGRDGLSPFTSGVGKISSCKLCGVSFAYGFLDYCSFPVQIYWFVTWPGSDMSAVDT